MTMTDTTCNGWRNAATWTVNLWFGDNFAAATEDGIDAETLEREAHLIAAAPDLLEALMGALDALDDSGEYPETARLGRAAIAKAEGN